MKRVLISSIILIGIGVLLYLATIGCCQLISSWKTDKGTSLTQSLQLTSTQQQEWDKLGKGFLAQKQASCEILCAKRAQLIQVLKQPYPPRETLNTLIEEIGQEQIALENTTIQHLLALRQHLDLSQQEKLNLLVAEKLRTACEMTACGVTAGCQVTQESR